MNEIFILLVMYQIKHFLADYPLQGRYMLGKFAPWPGCLPPLVAHAGVHAAFTLAIAMFVKPSLAIPLALLDFVVHGVMDFVKANPSLLGRFKAISATEYLAAKHAIDCGTPWEPTSTAQLRGNKYFWWALGFDQGVHHLTHYAIIWGLVS